MHEEEGISKKALELFESGFLDALETGTFQAFCDTHKYLFDDIYGYAGKIRIVNIAKGKEHPYIRMDIFNIVIYISM